MKLYCLGKVPWEESQLIYHALASLGREAVSLVSPASPYVCIGYHQDAEREVDLAYCRSHHVPVFRREVGGGAVYLDGNQLFFQIILHKDHPMVTPRKEAFYRKFLQPAIEVYRRIGIPAEYKPVNDLVVEGRKISGTGAGEIGDCIVFVGNLILDFDYRMMSRILKVPDEKFRDKVKKTLEENVTTLSRELGEKEAAAWDEARLNRLMIEAFERMFGPLESHDVDPVLRAKMNELGLRMINDSWLHRPRKGIPGRVVKIRSGIKVVHHLHKAPGGLIRADFEVRDGRFGTVSLSGDFICFPRDAVSRLASRLEGRPTEEVPSLLAGFEADQEIETPGVGIDDWLKVFNVF